MSRNIYRDRLIQEAFEVIEKHTDYVKVGRKIIEAIKYADDHAVIAIIEEKLQQMN